MATPTPTIVRPKIAHPMVGAIPRTMEPAKATMKKTVMVLRGPQESDSRPAGSCMRA